VDRWVKLNMSPSKETQGLEAELEQGKQDLRQDLSQIEDKLHQTRVRLSPSTLIREKALLMLGVGFALGFVLGYWDVPLEDIGKPVARTMATTVGKQIAARALKG
jgi:hypothetical protein